MESIDYYSKFEFYPSKDDVFTEYTLIKRQISEAKQQCKVHRMMNRSALLKFFNEQYGPYHKFVDRLICYDLGNLKMTIKNPPPVLKIECGHDVLTRHDLFNDTMSIFSKTGWYPYITGINQIGSKSFALSEQIEWALEHHAQDNIRRVGGLGPLGELKIATLLDPSKMAPEEEFIGNSCVVRTNFLNIILDAGIERRRLRSENLSEEDVKLVLITHPHDDHAKAFREFMLDENAFIVSGFVTLEFLLRKYCSQDTFRELLESGFFERFIPVRFDQCIEFVDGSSITAVATEHHPGSVGFILKFNDGRQLFYSGDVNFESRFFRGTTINELTGKRFDYSVIDGSQLSRKFRDSEIEGEGEDVLKSIQESMESGENNVIVTNSRDYGVQLFLSLYPMLIDKRGLKAFSPLLIDHEIIEQIWVIENWLMRGERGSKNLDRDIIKNYGKSFLTRSVKVHPYDPSSIRNFESIKYCGYNFALILDEFKLARHPSYLPTDMASLMKSRRVKVTALVKKRLDPSAHDRLSDYFGEDNIKEFGGYRWYLHTPADSLKKIVLEQADIFGKIYIFHTTRAMIKDFDSEIRAKGYGGQISALPDNIVNLGRSSGAWCIY